MACCVVYGPCSLADSDMHVSTSAICLMGPAQVELTLRKPAFLHASAAHYDMGVTVCV